MPSLRIIGLIYRREMLDLLRDRRTLFGMILVPVLVYPLLMVGASHLLVEQVTRIERQTFRAAVAGWDDLADLRESLPDPEAGPGERAAAWEVRAAGPGDREALRRDVAEGRLHVLLEFPPDAARRVAAGETVDVRARYNGADDSSLAAWRNFQDGFARFRRRLVERRLRGAAVNPSLLDPFNVATADAASATRRGAFHLGRIICAMFVMMAAMGAFHPAVDAASGEKERGTMQTLLVSPARRSEIVLGKYFAVLSVCLVTAALNLASMGLTFSSLFGGVLQRAQIEFAPTPASLLLMLVLLIPLAGLFSAVCLGISAYAGSYKEAMLYLSPFLLAASLGGFAPLVPGLRSSWALELTPVVNASLVLYHVVQGVATAGEIALSFAVNSAYAFLALRWVGWIFEREDVLLRGPSEVRWRFWERPAVPRPHPSMLEGVVGCGLLVALAVFISGWLQGAPFLVLLVVLQLGAILLPALVILRAGGVDARLALRLRFPGWPNLAAAALSAAALVYASSAVIFAILAGLKWLGLPFDEGRLAQGMEPFQQALGPDRGFFALAATVFLIAGVAPVCEEIAFRGFLLSSLRPVLGTALGVLATSAVFGLLHPPLPRQLALALVGAVLGFMVTRTGSLWTAVTAHAVNNGTALLLAAPYLARGAAPPPEAGPPPLLAVLAVGVVGLGLWMLEERPKEKGERRNGGAINDG